MAVPASSCCSLLLLLLLQEGSQHTKGIDPVLLQAIRLAALFTTAGNPALLSCTSWQFLQQEQATMGVLGAILSWHSGEKSCHLRSHRALLLRVWFNLFTRRCQL